MVFTENQMCQPFVSMCDATLVVVKQARGSQPSDLPLHGWLTTTGSVSETSPPVMRGRSTVHTPNNQ